MIKASLLLTFVVVIGFGFFTSCSRNNVTPVESNDPMVSASLGSTSFNTTNVSASDNGSAILITGSQTDGTKFSVGLSSYTKAGSYAVSETGAYTLQYSKNSSHLYNGTSGTIVVKSYADHIIKGTFSGEAYNFVNPSDIIQITNGQFTAKLK
jgi:hypothetical protein